GRRVRDPGAGYRAHERFGRRRRWLPRQARNEGRRALRAAGMEFGRLPQVLIQNVELQKRGAFHSHLALPYTTPLEIAFARAFIEALKLWAPRCGLGFVQGWQQAEKGSIYGANRAAGYMTTYLTSKHPPAMLQQI